MDVKYPHVHVKMVGEDGNAFSILGRVSKAMKRAGLRAEAEEFLTEATSGDYDHLLQTCMIWVNCDSDPDECEFDCD